MRTRITQNTLKMAGKKITKHFHPPAFQTGNMIFTVHVWKKEGPGECYFESLLSGFPTI